MNVIRTGVLLALAVACAALARPASAITLSGANEFNATSTGAYGAGNWNTLGGDSTFNLFVIQGGIGGAFVNGPTDALANISIPLAPGDTLFTFHTSGVGDFGSFFGLNLYFDGANAAPGISVFAAKATSTVAPAFFADSASSTPNLFFVTNPAALVPAAGTLAYASSSEMVALTSYIFMAPSVNNTDRVGNFTTGADSVNDFVGQFTLHVAPVPEPASLALLGLSALGLSAAARRRRPAAGP